MQGKTLNSANENYINQGKNISIVRPTVESKSSGQKQYISVSLGKAIVSQDWTSPQEKKSFREYINHGKTIASPNYTFLGQGKTINMENTSEEDYIHQGKVTDYINQGKVSTVNPQNYIFQEKTINLSSEVTQGKILSQTRTNFQEYINHGKTIASPNYTFFVQGKTINMENYSEEDYLHQGKVADYINQGKVIIINPQTYIFQGNTINSNSEVTQGKILSQTGTNLYKGSSISLMRGINQGKIIDLEHRINIQQGKNLNSEIEIKQGEGSGTKRRLKNYISQKNSRASSRNTYKGHVEYTNEKNSLEYVSQGKFTSQYVPSSALCNYSIYALQETSNDDTKCALSIESFQRAKKESCPYVTQGKIVEISSEAFSLVPQGKIIHETSQHQSLTRSPNDATLTMFIGFMLFQFCMPLFIEYKVLKKLSLQRQMSASYIL